MTHALRTVAIVQARMGSTRLPGKVLLPLEGRTLLTYLVRRLSGSRCLDHLVVATTIHARDDRIAIECRRHGVDCFRGSERDVLARYEAAANATDADIVVRVTADNPFTDVESIDRVVTHIMETRAEYVIEDGLPVGTTGEAMTRGLLDRMAATAREERWREHVTLYAKENPSTARAVFLEPRARCGFPELRLTVDEWPDYQRVRRLAGAIDGLGFDLPALIRAAKSLNAGCLGFPPLARAADRPLQSTGLPMRAVDGFFPEHLPETV